MALETAKQRDKKDVISETEFKLGEVEMKLARMIKSKTQVIEGSCFFIYTVYMRLALQGPDYCHLLQFHHRILIPAVFSI
jgi:hypothetical protein